MANPTTAASTRYAKVPPLPPVGTGTAAGLGTRAAGAVSAAVNLPAMYEGNPREVFNQYRNDRLLMESDFPRYLRERQRAAKEENLKAADAMIAGLTPEELKGVSPASLRQLYAEIDARSKGALASFRELAFQAGWADADSSVYAQDEAGVRMMGYTMMADIWDKTSKADVALDAAGLVAGMFEDDTELPSNFNSEVISRLRSMPGDFQIASLLTWREELVNARGNFFDFGVDSTPEARTNTLRVLQDLDSFFEGTSPEANKLVDRLGSILTVVDAGLIVKALGRRASTFNRAVRNSAARRETRAAQAESAVAGSGAKAEAPQGVDTPATPEAAPRAAQEATEGVTPTQGEAPLGPEADTLTPTNVVDEDAEILARRSAVTKQDKANASTGGVAAQRVSDRAAAESGTVQQGQRVTREALQEAAAREREAQLDALGQPRAGEPTVSTDDSRQLDLEFPDARGRVEPSVGPAGRDPNTPVVTYGNRGYFASARREPAIGEAVVIEDGVKISLPDPADELTEFEKLGALVGATAARSKPFARATNTSQEEIIAQVIPGAEELTATSPEIGAAVADILDAPAKAARASLKVRLLTELNRLQGTDIGPVVATTGEVKKAIANARRALYRETRAALAAEGELAKIAVRRVGKVENLGDYNYRVRFRITDQSTDEVAGAVIGEKEVLVTLGKEDVRASGDTSKVRVIPILRYIQSRKSLLGLGTGRTADLMIENFELASRQVAAYQRIFEQAYREVFSGLTRGERRETLAIIARSRELGNGGHLELSAGYLKQGVTFEDGTVLYPSEKVIEAYQKFTEVVEANTHVMNAMRTISLRSKKMQRVQFQGIADVYVRQVGQDYIDSISAMHPIRRPRIYNAAGAARQDGTVPKYIDFDDGPFGFVQQFWKSAHTDAVLVKLDNPLQVGDEYFDLVMVNRTDVSDIPEVIPMHPKTWIPTVPDDAARFRVVRTTFGTLNGVENQPIRRRVVARAASQGEAEVYSEGAKKAGGAQDAFEVERDFNGRWKGDIDPFGSNIVPDDDFVENIGLGERLDPVQSIARSLAILSRSIPIASFRRLQPERWFNDAQRAGVLAAGRDFFSAVLDGNFPNKKVLEAFKETREAINKVIGWKTQEETVWETVVSHLAEKLIQVNTVGSAALGRRVYSLTDRDPIGFMQGVSMHTLLGFARPDQLLVQSSNVLYAMSAGYKDAAQAWPLVPLMVAQRAINYGGDAAVAATRQEYLARSAVAAGLFKSKDDYYAAVNAWNASGLANDLDNVADYASMDVSDLNWMNSFTAGAEKLSLVFYNSGVFLERSYAFSLAVQNYNRFLRNSGIQRTPRSFTRADWLQVMADTENLTLNMSKANKARFQENGFTRLPTQFMQVMTKFVESVFGTSRLITGEDPSLPARVPRAGRLLATQLALFGIKGIVPVAGAGLAAMAYQTFFGKTPAEDAAEDPEGTKLRYSALQNGLLNMSSQVMFGSELGIGGRLSILEGIGEILTDVAINDKSALSLALGASGTWVTAFTNGREEILWPVQLAAGNFDNPELALNYALNGLDFISSLNNANIALTMQQQHRLITRSGVTLDSREFSDAEIWAQAAGFRLQDSIDLPKAQMDKKAEEERLTRTARVISQMIATSWEAGKPANMELAAPILQSLTPREQRIVATKVSNILLKSPDRRLDLLQNLIDKPAEELTPAEQSVVTEHLRREATNAQP